MEPNGLIDTIDGSIQDKQKLKVTRYHFTQFLCMEEIAQKKYHENQNIYILIRCERMEFSNITFFLLLFCSSLQYLYSQLN